MRGNQIDTYMHLVNLVWNVNSFELHNYNFNFNYNRHSFITVHQSNLHHTTRISQIYLNN